MNTPGILLNTTNSFGVFNSGNLDVSSVSPGSRPVVSDDKVLLVVIYTISNYGDSKVDVSAAVGRIENSPGVHLENHIVSCDVGRNWAKGDRCFQLSD